MFEAKEVPRLKLLPLAAAYVGYIVLCNLNLNINPIGFYQISKIAGVCSCARAAAVRAASCKTMHASAADAVSQANEQRQLEET